MTWVRRLLPIVLVLLVAAGAVAIAARLREKQQQADEVARDIERQLRELDPVTRAATVARLGASARSAVNWRR